MLWPCITEPQPEEDAGMGNTGYDGKAFHSRECHRHASTFEG